MVYEAANLGYRWPDGSLTEHGPLDELRRLAADRDRKRDAWGATYELAAYQLASQEQRWLALTHHLPASGGTVLPDPRSRYLASLLVRNPGVVWPDFVSNDQEG